MATTTSAALIAAENFILITRIAPGGGETSAGKLRHDCVKLAAHLMAKTLPATAGPEERTSNLIHLADVRPDLFHPTDMSGPDLKKMSANARHEYANERAHSKSGGGK